MGSCVRPSPLDFGPIRKASGMREWTIFLWVGIDQLRIGANADKRLSDAGRVRTEGFVYQFAFT